jgi:hypothetical protein
MQFGEEQSPQGGAAATAKKNGRKEPSAAEPQPKKKPGFHRRGAEFTEFGMYLYQEILDSAFSASRR